MKEASKEQYIKVDSPVSSLNIRAAAKNRKPKLSKRKRKKLKK